MIDNYNIDNHKSDNHKIDNHKFDHYNIDSNTIEKVLDKIYGNYLNYKNQNYKIDEYISFIKSVINYLLDLLDLIPCHFRVHLNLARLLQLLYSTFKLS